MKLYLMQLGSASAGGPVPGYLVQTADGKNILVDSGYPRDRYGDGAAYPAEHWVVNRLAEIGLTPDDIDIVVCSHMDHDHAGSHDHFPTAEFVVQGEHLTAAREMPRFQSIREHWDDPRLNYRTVSGDTELVPGVELIETSGHVPGHQSVLVRLPHTGPVLLAIDAMSQSFDGFTPETRPTATYDDDPEGTRRSTRKLVDLAEREGVTLTIYGHDTERWQPLKKMPEYYE